MKQTWIIDVLEDLKAFAEQNKLPLLAQQLSLTSTVARAEIVPQSEGAPRAIDVNASQPHPPPERARTGQRT